MKTVRVVELYCGTARGAEAFRAWRRAEISLLVDSDKVAQKTYLANRPNAPFLRRDLARLSAPQIRAEAGGRVDVLLGCPPCQGFSDVGNRDPNDDRNDHLRRFGFLTSVLRPKVMVMENVPRAVSAVQFDTFTSSLVLSGYRWTAGLINSALRGSAQCRQRLVLVAFREDLKIDPELPVATHGGRRKYFNYSNGKLQRIEQAPAAVLGEAPATHYLRASLPFDETDIGDAEIPTIEEAFAGLPRLGTEEARRLGHVAWAHSAKQIRRMSRVPEGGRWRGGLDHYSHSYGRLHRKGLARTITTNFNNPGSGRFWHPTEERALTPREAARLQGFPDTFLFAAPYSHAARLIGNALDSTVASIGYEIARRVLE